MIHKLLPSETVLPDDYPINAMYVYIVDGVFKRAHLDTTVGEWKRQGKIKEIRRCELFKHGDAKLGDQVQ